MDATLLLDIPFRIEIDSLLKRVHVDAKGEHGERVRQLARQAEAVARPKGMCKVAYVEERSNDSAVIDGIRFISRVLRVNLDGAHRVFPFLATCGRELHEWAGSFDDLLESFWAGAIMETALGAAYDAIAGHVQERYQPGPMATMNPGSLADWPMSEQQQLFNLLGDPRQAIGVELTDSFLMVPIKSVSGLHFPTATHYENCQLCPRERCPGRRAPYDKELYERKYR